MIDHGQFAVPGTTRSRLILEVASELVGEDDWLQKQAKVSLRTQGTVDWPLTLFASDNPEASSSERVLDKEVSGMPLELSYRHTEREPAVTDLFDGRDARALGHGEGYLIFRGDRCDDSQRQRFAKWPGAAKGER